MQLSVVILNYNVRYFLEQCVASVQKAITNLDAEIIVVDNNSPDDSCEMMKTRFPGVRLIENRENSGFPKGNNLGVAAAKGKYICILNPDTVVAEDTFEKVIAFAEKQTDLGIVGVKLIDGTGKFLPESKRGIPTPFVALTKIAGLYRIFPKSQTLGRYYASNLSENETGKVEILVGAFMLMRRSLYAEIGGFDENCFMYSDDIDLSYMVLKSGRSNYYFGETSVIHYKGESTVRDAKYMQRFREAMDFFYKKHFRRSYLFDVFMKSGAWLFSFIKRSRPVAIRKPDRYLLVSGDIGLERAVSAVLGQGIELIRPEELKNVRITIPTQIIFDNRVMSHGEMINFMCQFRSALMTFRVAHPEEGFAIGSDSSNDRGEVLKLTLNRQAAADGLKNQR